MPYGLPRIPIGKRRERVAVQRAVSTDDGSGGRTVTWQTIAQPWAQVVALDERTKEGMDGEQLTAQHAYHVAIAYRAGLTNAMRLKRGTQVLNIHSIADDLGTRRRLILQCGEVQST